MPVQILRSSGEAAKRGAETAEAAKPQEEKLQEARRPAWSSRALQPDPYGAPQSEKETEEIHARPKTCGPAQQSQRNETSGAALPGLPRSRSQRDRGEARLRRGAPRLHRPGRPEVPGGGNAARQRSDVHLRG